MNKQTPVRLLSSYKRKTTFQEVSLGYNKKEALLEANRCLNCKNPLCVKGCPVNVNIPLFIRYIKEHKLKRAYQVILKQNAFPGICGRVCPQEKQCESKCIQGIKNEPVAIGRLERFVFDKQRSSKINNKVVKKHKSVAIVGSGPAGLACASKCLDEGLDVTMFEALHQAGGVLVYGIPEFRLPKTIVNKEINQLIEKGLVLKTNYVIGKTLTLDELLNQYDYIFLAVGAGFPRFMNIKGENLNGVMSSNEFLTRINLMKAYKDEYDTPLLDYKNIVVVGGGNVAMDAARCAKRLKAKVTLVYRRDIDQMPARKEEIDHAIEENIIFKTLTNPYKIVGDEKGNTKAVYCHKMSLGEKDASGRASFNIIKGKTCKLKVDLVIMALGNYPNPILKESTDLVEFDKYGLIKINEKYQTSNPRIYAGGDIVTGAATVILAMEAGKKAAQEIMEAIS